MMRSLIFVLSFFFVHSKKGVRGAKYRDVRDEIASVIADHAIVQTQEASPISLRRNLGDFDDLNALFNGMVLGLPNLYIANKKILGATVRVWVKELRCNSLRVDDIIMTYGKFSNSRFDFGVDIQGLDISCTFNWRYKWRCVKSVQ